MRLRTIAKIIRRMPAAVRYVRLCNRADSSLVARDYAAALAELDEAERVPGYHPDCDFPLKKAMTLHHLERHQEALIFYERAFLCLQKGRMYMRSSHDIAYMKAYASLHGLNICRYFGQEDVVGFRVDYANVQLARVRGIVRADFPMPSHPDWSSLADR